MVESMLAFPIFSTSPPPLLPYQLLFSHLSSSQVEP
jgi:hypothetical protein